MSFGQVKPQWAGLLHVRSAFQRVEGAPAVLTPVSAGVPGLRAPLPFLPRLNAKSRFRAHVLPAKESAARAPKTGSRSRPRVARGFREGLGLGAVPLPAGVSGGPAPPRFLRPSPLRPLSLAGLPASPSRSLRGQCALSALRSLEQGSPETAARDRGVHEEAARGGGVTEPLTRDRGVEI